MIYIKGYISDNISLIYYSGFSQNFTCVSIYIYIYIYMVSSLERFKSKVKDFIIGNF